MTIELVTSILCFILTIYGIVDLFMFIYVYRDHKNARVSSIIVSTMKIVVFGQSAVDFYLNGFERLSFQLILILLVTLICAVRRGIILIVYSENHDFKGLTTVSHNHTQ